MSDTTQLKTTTTEGLHLTFDLRSGKWTGEAEGFRTSSQSHATVQEKYEQHLRKQQQTTPAKGSDKAPSHVVDMVAYRSDKKALVPVTVRVRETSEGIRIEARKNARGGWDRLDLHASRELHLVDPATFTNKDRHFWTDRALQDLVQPLHRATEDQLAAAFDALTPSVTERVAFRHTPEKGWYTEPAGPASEHDRHSGLSFYAAFPQGALNMVGPPDVDLDQWHETKQHTLQRGSVTVALDSDERYHTPSFTLTWHHQGEDHELCSLRATEGQAHQVIFHLAEAVLRMEAQGLKPVPTWQAVFTWRIDSYHNQPRRMGETMRWPEAVDIYGSFCMPLPDTRNTGVKDQQALLANQGEGWRILLPNEHDRRWHMFEYGLRTPANTEVLERAQRLNQAYRSLKDQRREAGDERHDFQAMTQRALKQALSLVQDGEAPIPPSVTGAAMERYLKRVANDVAQSSEFHAFQALTQTLLKDLPTANAAITPAKPRRSGPRA